MKKLIFIFGFLISLTVSASAQKQITITKTVSGSGTSIHDKNHILSQASLGDIGTEQIGTYVHSARTYFKFNLSSIPLDAQITKVNVVYTFGRYSAKLTDVQTIPSGDLGEIWTLIGSANTILSGLPNTASGPSGSGLESPELKTLIQNSLPYREFYIGALSEREDAIDSYSGMTLDLLIEYTYTIYSLNIVVQNDLQGAAGGNIGVGVYPAPADSKPSPFTESNSYENDQLNLAAYDNQSVNGNNWIFNDNEGPVNKSSWAKKIGGTLYDWGVSQVFTSGKLSTNDGNAAIIAYLKKLKTTTSGTLTENEYWFTNNISLSGNVAVPTGINLRLGKGITIKLNGYTITSTGGTITDEGATFSDLAAYVKTSSNVIVGYSGSIQSACNAVATSQKVEIKPGTYNTGFSLTGKSSVTISGYGATVNGTINLNNDSYCNLYGVYLPTGQVYISGGIGLVIMDVRSDAGNRSLNIENTTNNAVYNLTAANGDMQDFGVNIYNSTGDICRSSRIENQMCGIFLYGGHYNVTEDYFCQNGYDVDAEGGGYAYLMNNTLSRINPASVYGTIYFDEPPTVACSSPSGLAKSNTASLSLNTRTEEKGIPADDLNRIYSDLLHRTIQDSALNHKSLIEKYKAEYLSTAEKSKDELKKSVHDLSKLKNYLSLTINCLRYLGEEESLSSYLNELLGMSDFQPYSPYIKKYFIPGLVSRNDFNGALALCNEVQNSKDIDKDLTCEMLYEKGIINRFYLNNNTEAYRAFSSITAKYPDHPLGKMAKGQISDMPELEIGNPGLKSLGSTSEGFTCSNYPNPFNPSTRFTFSIPGDGFTELKIYNSLGQEVKALVSDYLTKGKYTFEWNAASYSSGIYYYFLKSGSNVTTSKIILLK
ncbi:MAG: T9SS type A sorting domain-containing protein [Candidatus Dadabacteria bacterium]